jgi:hypothetical protein
MRNVPWRYQNTRLIRRSNLEKNLSTTIIRERSSARLLYRGHSFYMLQVNNHCVPQISLAFWCVSISADWHSYWFSILLENPSVLKDDDKKISNTRSKGRRNWPIILNNPFLPSSRIKEISGYVRARNPLRSNRHCPQINKFHYARL